MNPSAYILYNVVIFKVNKPFGHRNLTMFNINTIIITKYAAYQQVQGLMEDVRLIN